MSSARRKIPLIATVFLAAATIPAAGQALPNRILVSGKGADAAGCGTPASPCRTFQYAHDHVAAGGEVIVMDSGDFGPVNITKSLSIVNDGAGTANATPAPIGFAGVVTINASPNDTVRLRGLKLFEIRNSSADSFGIYFRSGGALSVENCLIQGFFTSDILVGLDSSTPANISISNVFVGDSSIGIFVGQSSTGLVTAVIDNVRSIDNIAAGIQINGPVKANISRSIFAGSIRGVSIVRGAEANFREASVSNNVLYGFDVDASTMRLAHSLASSNDVAGVNISNSAVVESYGDNNLRGNGVAVSGGNLTPVAKQ